MKYQIRGIPNEMVEKVWNWAEPFIKRALDYTFGEMSHEDIKRLCLNRDAQLWMVADEAGVVVGAGTTQIVDYPRMKVCRVLTLAGTRFDDWNEVTHSVIEAWAKTQNCSDMEHYVRKGFVPKLQSLGYKHRYSVVHKTL